MRESERSKREEIGHWKKKIISIVKVHRRHPDDDDDDGKRRPEEDHLHHHHHRLLVRVFVSTTKRSTGDGGAVSDDDRVRSRFLSSLVFALCDGTYGARGRRGVGSVSGGRERREMRGDDEK